MKRQSKSQRPVTVIRGVLAQNLIALRDRKWPHLPNATKRNEALASLCKPTSKSQIQRIMAQQLGTSIDLLELLAYALDVRPQDLLTPYFASMQIMAHPQIAPIDDGLHRGTDRPTPVSGHG